MDETKESTIFSNKEQLSLICTKSHLVYFVVKAQETQIEIYDCEDLHKTPFVLHATGRVLPTMHHGYGKRVYFNSTDHILSSLCLKTGMMKRELQTSGKLCALHSTKPLCNVIAIEIEEADWQVWDVKSACPIVIPHTSGLTFSTMTRDKIEFIDEQGLELSFPWKHEATRPRSKSI